MHRHTWRVCTGLLFASVCIGQTPIGMRTLTWQETQQNFRSNNPTLLAGRVLIDESKAEEITAYLRPNPTMTLGLDQVTPFQNSGDGYRPLSQSYLFGNFDYLHERRHKRELRFTSAQQATDISISTQQDLERNLMFNLRDAFVRVLLSKAVLQIANENLAYFDREVNINRQRFEAGDMSHVDFERVQLQRIQYQSDFQTATVNLRTAKIDLQQLLRDRTPVDQFDVTEPFEFSDPSTNLDQLHSFAIENRPDLKEAVQTVDKSKTDHKLAIANGSTDPTFGVDASHQPPPLNTYVGLNVSIPLRIFDRNQGEKLRTSLDIGRNQKLADAAQIAVLHDVDSAWATLRNTLETLKPYKTDYLPQALDVRDTVSFAYSHGAATLLEYLDAQKSYRDTELSYLNLVGAYLSAANQVNFTVGREVIR